MVLFLADAHVQVAADPVLIEDGVDPFAYGGARGGRRCSPACPTAASPTAGRYGWPPVRFVPDTSAAMRAELRAYGAVLGEMAGALRDLEARLGRRSLLVEEEPEPELGATVVEAAAGAEAAARACR